MASAPNLFPLKAIVISLGILLIGGTIFLFATLASKASAGLAHANCQSAEAKLGTPGKVLGINPQGENIAVTLETPTDMRVITIDNCTGKVLRTLTIVP